MLIFGLCSTSDDQLSDLSNNSQLKYKKKKKKKTTKLSKNEMLIFELCSSPDDWPSNLSNESQLKCKKKKLLPNHHKMKCSFLDYVQLQMISQAI